MAARQIDIDVVRGMARVLLGVVLDEGRRRKDLDLGQLGAHRIVGRHLRDVVKCRGLS